MSETNLSPLIPLLQPLSSQGRTALLPALHIAQEIYGHIPEDVAVYVGEQLNVPLSEVSGVIEFYTLFLKEPVGKTIVHVCHDPACAIAGADGVFKMMQQKTEGTGEKITIERAHCLGLCAHTPAVLVQDTPIVRAEQFSWSDLDGSQKLQILPHISSELNLLTKNCGKGVSTSLEEYQAAEGYQALRKVLTMSPNAVIEEVKSSGLLGRGGAAFPTGLKWESTANAPGDLKYVVCNADEAEPGTFKDRILMEDDPHSVLEGLIIAAYAVGAHKGYFYIRGEYLKAFHAVQKAVEDAYHHHLLGKNILNSGFSLELEIRLGAGAYVCGEETALFESIEGKRGFPRIKPPFPTTHGLFGCPTVINNVETLCNIPLILREGAEVYRKIGTEKSTGPKLFCVSGDVKRPGLYEIPFGISLRKLIFEMAGGIRENRHFQTALIGGAAGAFAAPEQLDTPLSFEDLRANGLPLGSGVITVFDDRRNLYDILNRLARFFADESCGKCFPCQLGTQRQYEIMQRISSGRIEPNDMKSLQDIGWTMQDASICGLGQTAASAILSATRHWPHLFQTQENM